ncbi:Actin-histidine N-methyltransferase [Picochlorum sp. SENEW3]|nr:Actin-histidine N-methyltransferase [Picochlorum sp. SENEW3]
MKAALRSPGGAVSTLSLPFCRQRLCKQSTQDKTGFALPNKNHVNSLQYKSHGLSNSPISVGNRGRLQALSTSAGEKVLENLLSWMVANGAKGLDPRDSKVSLFISDDGERGLIATTDVSRGSILFQIPMRIALLDDEPGSPECDIDFDNDVPWSVRLACKLLRLKSQGEASVWKPYQDSLPDYVPSATALTFSYENIQCIGYAYAREQIDFLSWVSISNFESLPSGAVPTGTTYEEFSHALAVVHSRTFSVPAKDRRGGVVRLLMPLVDMLNHSGDVDVSMSADRPMAASDIIATDAVRWDCVAKIGGEFEMIVSATRDIIQGEEITLSYGERSNDDFFLYYGFVPVRNPHDSVQLFANLDEGISWALGNLSALIPEGDAEDIQARVDTFVRNTPNLSQNIDKEVQNFEPLDSKRLSDDKARIVLQSNGRVDERIVIVLEELHGLIKHLIGEQSKSRFVQQMIAERSFEILADMKKSCNAMLTQDLETLASWETHLDEYVDPDDVLCHQFARMASLLVPKIQDSEWFERLSQISGDSIPSFDITDADSLRTEFGDFHVPEQLLTGEETTLEDGNQTHDSVLPIMYRAYKQYILWDALLAIQ